MMQIQALNMAGSQPVGAVLNDQTRQSSGVGVSTQQAVQAQVGGLQSKAVTGASALEKQTTVSQEDVSDAVEKVNEAVSMFGSQLQFLMDTDADAVVVKVVDKETHEVIRQIPSEEVLNIAKALDKLQGLLIKDKA